MKLHLSLLALPAATRALIPTGSKPVPPPMRVATAELFESQEPLLDTLSKKRRRRRRAPAAVDLAGGLDALPARSSGEASSRRGRAQMQRRDDAPLTTMGRRARRLRFVSSVAPLHGWVPDVAQFRYGLPLSLIHI